MVNTGEAEGTDFSKKNTKRTRTPGGRNAPVAVRLVVLETRNNGRSVGYVVTELALQSCLVAELLSERAARIQHSGRVLSCVRTAVRVEHCTVQRSGHNETNSECSR